MDKANNGNVPPETFVVIPGNDGSGKPVFSVLLKRSYDIGEARCARKQMAAPFVRIDEYYDDGDPETSTVKFESDIVPYKPATDVVVIGKAYAPGGKPVQELDVGVQIANTGKTIRVIGDRQCIHRKKKLPLFTDPLPFREMEIRYEKAYGGWDLKSDPNLPLAYPRNMMGTGIALKNVPKSIDGLVLPNLENPLDLLSPDRIILEEPENWNRQPIPEGTGWFQKTWYPRCSFIGSIPAFVRPDEVMREERLGIVPQGQIEKAFRLKLPGFDAKFNNGASIGMAFPYLKGDEDIQLRHMHPERELLSLSLPGETPKMMLDIGLGENELRPELQTVCIQPDKMQVDMVWFGCHEYPGVDWLPEMKRMRAEVC